MRPTAKDLRQLQDALEIERTGRKLDEEKHKQTLELLATREKHIATLEYDGARVSAELTQTKGHLDRLSDVLTDLRNMLTALGAVERPDEALTTAIYRLSKQRDEARDEATFYKAARVQRTLLIEHLMEQLDRLRCSNTVTKDKLREAEDTIRMQETEQALAQGHI